MVLVNSYKLRRELYLQSNCMTTQVEFCNSLKAVTIAFFDTNTQKDICQKLRTPNILQDNNSITDSMQKMNLVRIRLLLQLQDVASASILLLTAIRLTRMT
jgi:hypothetical protein